MNKINLLIAPNSFKECAGASEIARIIEAQFDETKFSCKSLPISDGGDGFLDICISNFNLRRLQIEIPSFFDNSVYEVPYAISADETKLYIESAEVIGMKKIPKEKRNPLQLNTSSFGILFSKLQNQFPLLKKIIVGVGGTATNDLGIGLASIYGLELLNNKNKKLPLFPKHFAETDSIKLPTKNINLPIELILDVKVPLLGKNGTSQNFAEQKGATEAEIPLLEAGVEKIISILKKQNVNSTSSLIGAGGGISIGLSLISKVRIRYAKDFLIDELFLEKEISDADFIISGEGAIDKQSFQNKGTGIMADLAFKYKKQLILISGLIPKPEFLKRYPKLTVFPLEEYYESAALSIQNYKKGIETASKEIASYILSHP